MTEETQKKISKWFWRIITFPVLLLIFMILLVWAFADIPSFKELENPESKLATQIIAEGGEVLTTFHIENRTYVTYEELSPNVVHAAIATEDARFYRHSGIDFKGLARVLFKTILMRNSSQGGGSTITQQLAKTLYPRSEAHSKIPGAYQVKMVWIKLKEWITAVKLEKNYTKDEIMTMYLNSIFFGSNAYGIRSASETFFGKQPSELTIEEAATLIGMANKPTRYNPALNPDKSLARRNFVIGQMEKAGYIDKHQRDSIREIPIELSYQVLDHNAGRAPYFRDMIRRVMTAKKPHRSDYNQREDFTVDSLAWANSELFGWIEKNRKADGSQYDLDRDGLRIYTTINYKMQQYAEEAVAERIRSLQKDFDRELRYKRNPPFANDIDQPTREKLMNQARKWSDRWRMLKKSGLTEAQILKTFSEPEKMRVFAYNNKGYIDTTMTPDDSIRYYKSLLRTSFVAMEPGTGRVKAYVGGPNYRYFKYDNVRQGKRQVGSTIKPFLYTLAMQEQVGYHQLLQLHIRLPYEAVRTARHGSDDAPHGYYEPCGCRPGSLRRSCRHRLVGYGCGIQYVPFQGCFHRASVRDQDRRLPGQRLVRVLEPQDRSHQRCDCVPDGEPDEGSRRGRYRAKASQQVQPHGRDGREDRYHQRQLRWMVHRIYPYHRRWLLDRLRGPSGPLPVRRSRSGSQRIASNLGHIHEESLG